MIYRDLKIIERSLEELIEIKKAQSKELEEKQKQFDFSEKGYREIEKTLEALYTQTGEMTAALQNLRITPLS